MIFPFWPKPQGYRNIDLGLSRVLQLLERVGNPHLNLPPTIHIAGTNGKGSTLSFLRSIFTESGLKVHTYTSPHLVNFNERILLRGEEISDDFLNKILHECRDAAELSPKIEVTFFEGITVAAFLAFSRVPADLLLLETGMGGRLDATNVLPEVLCSVITPIAFDHMDFLGKTLPKIAFEKSGIIKKNCPVFVGRQKKSALRVIDNRALELGVEVRVFNRDWKVSKRRKGFLLNGFDRKIALPMPSLLGDHQIENASLAVAVALSCKNFSVDENHIKSALTKTIWPARLQRISSGKFAEILPKNCQLYLDGSHNLQGATTVAKFLESQKNRKVFAIFSMLEDKDCRGFLSEISQEVDLLVAMEIPNEAKSRKTRDICEIALDVGINAEISSGFEAAFEKILSVKNSEDEALILVCGSLYLAGSFLAANVERSQKSL